MKAKRAKAGKRKPAARHVAMPVALGLKVKTLRDGSALVLDSNGGTVGLIEARPRYHARETVRGQKRTDRT